MKNSLFLPAVLFSTFAISISSARSAEADNFTAYNLNLADVSAPINTIANEALNTAVEKLNSAGNCDADKAEENLYNELKNTFSNHSKGELVKTILYTENIQKNALPLKNSVYGEWKPLDGYLLGRKKAASSPLALSPLIQVGEQAVGVDKLEHMFGMGFSYFTQYYKKEKSIEHVLKVGILKEKTFLGGNILATGVFSYGDLSANFNGMRFWNHVLLKHDDILGKEYNLGPYVSCVNSKWKVNSEKPIDFKNYVDASMDESINCSKFASKSGERKFKAAITEMGMSCPMDQSKLNAIREKYKALNIQHFIINDEGTDTVSYFNEF